MVSFWPHEQKVGQTELAELTVPGELMVGTHTHARRWPGMPTAELN